MDRETVLSILGSHRDDLRRRFGVRSLALFGSVVRNQAGQHSDVDLLVEFDDRPVGLFDLFRLEDHMATLLGGAKVDLVLRRAIVDELKDVIYGEAVDVVG